MCVLMHCEELSTAWLCLVQEEQLEAGELQEMHQQLVSKEAAVQADAQAALDRLAASEVGGTAAPRRPPSCTAQRCGTKELLAEYGSALRDSRSPSRSQSAI